ncbi:MAG: hypothetical protein M5U09_05460 [Gammaproteobacteria bacterium]|nr:hypothetical protein [Gammaproteobacteria bacterium]
MELVVKWFDDARAAADPADTEAELRLESDADRVKVVTMHAAKGLQFEVVYCPFAWDGVLRAGKGEAVFHDPDNDRRPTLDFGSPAIEAHRALAEREEFAENVRLLYVALTRARQYCVVHAGAIRGAETSPWPGSCTSRPDSRATSPTRNGSASCSRPWTTRRCWRTSRKSPARCRAPWSSRG